MDNNLKLVTKSIEKIVNIFEKCITKFVKCHKNPAWKDAIWKQLEELDIEQGILPVGTIN